MSNRLMWFCLCLVIATSRSNSTPAATIQMTPNLSSVYTRGTYDELREALLSKSPHEVELRASRSPDGVYLLQIDVLLMMSDLDHDQLGFADALFDVNLGPGLMPNEENVGWHPDPIKFDYPRCGVRNNKWGWNNDLGSDWTDLKSIFVSADNCVWVGNEDGLRRLGQPPRGAYAGAFFVEMSDAPHTTSSITVDMLAGSVFEPGFVVTRSGVELQSFTLNITVVPEPSSLLLLGMLLSFFVLVWNYSGAKSTVVPPARPKVSLSSTRAGAWG